MRTSSPGTWPEVQRLDRSASIRSFAGECARRDIRFREAIVDYRMLFEHAGGPLDPFRAACLRRWADRWPNRTVRSITAADLAEYFAELVARGHRPGEIRRERRLLGSFHGWARRCGWLKDDPGTSPAGGRPWPGRPVAWTASEQRRLLDACRSTLRGEAAARGGEPAEEPFLHPLVLLGLGTGLPVDTMLRLEWRHVNLEKERISIPAGETRAGISIDAPVGYDARRVLAALRRRATGLGPAPRRVFEAVRIPLAGGRPDEHAALDALRRARRRAGIPDGDFRSLRRSFLRNCASAGVPREDAARMCGWDDPGTPLQ